MVVRVGCDLAQHGYLAREAVDVVHREVHARLVGHGQQVQHGVGRAAHGDVERHGVLEGRLRGDRARQQRVVAFEVVAFGVADDERGGLFEQPAARDVRGDDRAVARQRESQRFGEAVHRVGGEHPRTRPAARAGAAFDACRLLVAATVVGAHHHRVDQVDVAVAETACFHRPARNEDRRNVEPHGGHQHSGRDLVAIADAHQCVDAMGVGHVFDAVGDDFARGERVEHPVVPHGDPVVDGDGVELGGETAARFDALFDLLADLVQVHVARDQLRERIGDADDRPVELFLAHAVGAPEASGSGHPTTGRRHGASEWMFHGCPFVFNSRFPAAARFPQVRLRSFGLTKTAPFFRVSLLNGEALLSGEKGFVYSYTYKPPFSRHDSVTTSSKLMTWIYVWFNVCMYRIRLLVTKQK